MVVDVKVVMMGAEELKRPKKKDLVDTSSEPALDFPTSSEPALNCPKNNPKNPAPTVYPVNVKSQIITLRTLHQHLSGTT